MPTPPLPAAPAHVGDGGEVLLEVAMLATRHLVAEVVQAALERHRDRVTLHPLPPDRRRAPELVRRMVEDGAAVLLVLCEASDPLEVGDTAAVVASSVVPTLVLCDPVPADRGVLLGAGATLVLPMSTRVDELHDALVGAAATGRQVPSAERVPRSDKGRPTADAQTSAARLAGLTRREAEVLGALSRGLSVELIAGATGVSVGTVRSHVRTVLRKLGTSSQLGAVAMLRDHADGRSRPPDST